MAVHDEHRVRISTPHGRRFDECEFSPTDEIYATLGLGKYMAGLDFLRAAHAAGRGDVLHGARTCSGISNVEYCTALVRNGFWDWLGRIAGLLRYRR